MGVSGAFDIAANAASDPDAPWEGQDGARELAREIVDIPDEAGFSRWPAPVQRSYRAEYEARLYREQRFLFMLGFAVALTTVALDEFVQPGLGAEGMFWRLVILTPLTILGLIAAHRRWTTVMTFCLGACPTAFMGIIAHLSFHLPPAFAGSYLTATGIILGLANLLMPFSPRALAVFNVSFIAVMAGVIAFLPDVEFWMNAHVIALLIAVALATGPIVLRFEALRQRSFLLNLKARAAAKELRAANRELRILSESDPLTGIYNRRGFERGFDKQMIRTSNAPDRLREKGRLAMVMIDVDHFKHFNDTHGHQSGDTCLSMVASHLQTVFDDISGGVCRYGGEEFLGAFREHYPGHAAEVGEQIRALIASLLVPIGPYSSTKGRSLITASIGIGLGHALQEGLPPEDAPRIREELIEMADAALYSAKRAGRNRVEIVELEPDRVRTRRLA